MDKARGQGVMIDIDKEVAELLPCRCLNREHKEVEACPRTHRSAVSAWARERELELEIELERIRTVLHAAEVDAKAWQDNAWAARNKQVEAERNLAALKKDSRLQFVLCEELNGTSRSS